jgi:hypothetical protein
MKTEALVQREGREQAELAAEKLRDPLHAAKARGSESLQRLRRDEAISCIYTVGGICSRLGFTRFNPRAMTTPTTPPTPTPAGDDRNLVAVDANVLAPTFEDKLLLFWEKNGKKVIFGCVLVLVGIVAKGGWEYLEAQKEADVQKEYAAAANTDKLKAFAAAHKGHALAGLAQLRIADEAYTAGKSADAISGYEAVIGVLKTGPFATRAQLGVAMSKIAAGQSAEGEALLKTMAGDVAMVKGVRVEAAYHLASLAADAGRADDVKKYSDQIAQIDPASPWTQRVMALKAALPVAGVAAPAVEAKKADAAPEGGIQVKLPGK